jgi:hypothetical protein
LANRELPVFKDKRAKAILEQLCRQHGVTLALLRDLVTIQRDHLGKGRQMGITQEFSAALSEFLESQDA